MNSYDHIQPGKIFRYLYKHNRLSLVTDVKPPFRISEYFDFNQDTTITIIAKFDTYCVVLINKDKCLVAIDNEFIKFQFSEMIF